MKLKAHNQRSLAKGQIWKTRAADIEIVALGNELIHYRITKQFGFKGVSAQISGIEAMANYLATNEARLVKGPSTNWFLPWLLLAGSKWLPPPEPGGRPWTPPQSTRCSLLSFNKARGFVEPRAFLFW